MDSWVCSCMTRFTPVCLAGRTEYFFSLERKKTAWLYLDNFFAKKQVFQEVAGRRPCTTV
jgi:hypothetical protein